MIIKPSFSNLPDEEIIHYFIEHSTIKIFSSSSSSSLLYELTLQPDVETPYFRANYLTYPQVKHDLSRNIRTLLMKVIVIDNNVPSTGEMRFIQVTTPSTPEEKPIELFCPSLYEFQKEVNTHIEIYHQSVQRFRTAICPAIIYTYQTKTTEQIHNMFTKLIPLVNNTKDQTLTEQLFQKITSINNRSCNEVNVGFLFMEALQGISVFAKINENPSMESTLHELCIIELEKLYRLGYVHGDPHLANFIFVPFCHDDLLPANKIFIIDFGRAQLISILLRKKQSELCKKVHVNSCYSILQKSTLMNYEYPFMELGYRYEHYNWLQLFVPQVVCEQSAP
jgi:hypothetical protein